MGLSRVIRIIVAALIFGFAAFAGSRGRPWLAGADVALGVAVLSSCFGRAKRLFWPVLFLAWCMLRIEDWLRYPGWMRIVVDGLIPAAAVACWLLIRKRRAAARCASTEN